jgi:7-cyano-7-deazaguanine synthase
MILCFSGGLDSYIAWHYLGYPQTVYFNLGSRYSDREERIVKRLIPQTIIDNSIFLGDVEKGERAHIPYRNLIIALVARKYDPTVVIAGLKDDREGDDSEIVFAKFTDFINTVEAPFSLTSPFFQLSKSEIVKWYLKAGLPPRALTATISCYSPDEETNYCGKCPSCFKKWVALTVNGFNLPFHNLEMIKKYKWKAEMGEFNPQRTRDTLKAIQILEKRDLPWL